MKVVPFLRSRANPNGTNGDDRVINNLAKCTAEMDAQVFVLGLTEKPSIAIGRAAVQSIQPPGDPFTLPSALTGALREIKPDVVHFHGLYTPRNVMLARWLRREGIRYAISPHGGLMQHVMSRERGKKTAFLSLGEIIAANRWFTASARRRRTLFETFSAMRTSSSPPADPRV